jgi:hypothetical protein
MVAQESTLTPAHHVVLYLISRLYPESSPGAIELMKLVYLADIEALRLTGQTITGCHYFRDIRGPYCEDVQEAVNDMDGHELGVKILPRASEYPKHEHCLGDAPRFQPELGPNATAILDGVLARLYGLSPMQIQELAFKTEPMEVVLSDERAFGGKLLGTDLDLGLVQPDPTMAGWRQNRLRYLAHPDPEREKELEQERREWRQAVEAL